MRITYRSHKGAQSYWEKRWQKSDVDTGGLSLDRYPGKFAALTMQDRRNGGNADHFGPAVLHATAHFTEGQVLELVIENHAFVARLVYRGGEAQKPFRPRARHVFLQVRGPDAIQSL